MFFKTFLSVVGFSSLFSVAMASNSAVISSPIEKMYIPMGYDDNDNIEIVLAGNFRNSCYKVTNSDFKIDQSNKTITLFPKSIEYNNSICAQMIVPFLQTLKIGTLEVGTYKVLIGSSQSIASQELIVSARHTEAPDDYIYAPVDDASLDFTNPSGEQSISVSGNYPLTFVGCAMMNQIKLNQSPGNVLVVMPIMDLLTSDEECKSRHWTPRFLNKIALPNRLPQGEYLVHVRVLNGSSYNKVITIK